MSAQPKFRSVGGDDIVGGAGGSARKETGVAFGVGWKWTNDKLNASKDRLIGLVAVVTEEMSGQTVVCVSSFF